MQDFSKFPLNFWRTIAKKYKGNPQAQLIAAYLFGCDHTNMFGVFYCPISYISQDLGSPLEGASKGLQDLQEGGFCTYDYENDMVWVHDIAKTQLGDKLKKSDNKVLWIISEFGKMPSGHIKKGFYKKYRKDFHIPIDEEIEAQIEENKTKNISPLEGASKGLSYIDVDINVDVDAEIYTEKEREKEIKSKASIEDFYLLNLLMLDEAKKPKKRKHRESEEILETGFQEWWLLLSPKMAVKKVKAFEIWKNKRFHLERHKIMEDTKLRQLKDSRWLAGFPGNSTTYLNDLPWRFDAVPTDERQQCNSLEEFRAAFSEPITYTSYERRDSSTMDSSSFREIQSISEDGARTNGDDESTSE